jgi:carbonic anhydrase
MVHGWIYALTDGRLRDLGLTAGSVDEATEKYRMAVAALG